MFRYDGIDLPFRGISLAYTGYERHMPPYQQVRLDNFYIFNIAIHVRARW